MQHHPFKQGLMGSQDDLNARRKPGDSPPRRDERLIQGLRPDIHNPTAFLERLSSPSRHSEVPYSDSSEPPQAGKFFDFSSVPAGTSNNDVLSMENQRFPQVEMGRKLQITTPSMSPVSASPISNSKHVVSERYRPKFREDPAVPSLPFPPTDPRLGYSSDSKAPHEHRHKFEQSFTSARPSHPQSDTLNKPRLPADEQHWPQEDSVGNTIRLDPAKADITTLSLDHASIHDSPPIPCCLDSQAVPPYTPSSLGPPIKHALVSRKAPRNTSESVPGTKRKSKLINAKADAWHASDKHQNVEIHSDTKTSKKKCKVNNFYGHQAQQNHGEIEGISGWGWRTKSKDDEWPAFVETRQICPIHDAKGNSVGIELHGTFAFSRRLMGKVSDDDGELVHELQKRNIFNINDISYTLDLADGAPILLNMKIKGVPKKIHGMSIGLIARGFCESMGSYEAPLETRAKARLIKSAEPVHVEIRMRPKGTENALECPRMVKGSDDVLLPDVQSVSHLEFKHATPGNKTTGFWRLPTQHFYRLVLQLRADVGDPENLEVIAEKLSELLLVRGRPPGGREKAKANSCPKSSREKRSSRESGRPSPIKKQNRRMQHKREEDDGVWADAFTPTMQANRPGVSDDVRGDMEKELTTKYHNTRSTSKRTYVEADLDRNDTSSSDDKSEDDYRDDDFVGRQHMVDLEEEFEVIEQDGEYDKEECEASLEDDERCGKYVEEPEVEPGKVSANSEQDAEYDEEPNTGLETDDRGEGCEEPKGVFGGEYEIKCQPGIYSSSSHESGDDDHHASEREASCSQEEPYQSMVEIESSQDGSRNEYQIKLQDDLDEATHRISGTESEESCDLNDYSNWYGGDMNLARPQPPTLLHERRHQFFEMNLNEFSIPFQDSWPHDAGLQSTLFTPSQLTNDNAQSVWLSIVPQPVGLVSFPLVSNSTSEQGQSSSGDEALMLSGPFPSEEDNWLAGIDPFELERRLQNDETI